MTEPHPARAPLRPEGSNIPARLFGPSPSQTVGPYFHQGLVQHGEQSRFPGDQQLVPGTALYPSERLTLTGRVLDADGLPVPDALLDVWQADLAGQRVDETVLTGFGRSDTRQDGGFWRFHTVKPVPRAGQAPHLDVWLGLRGLLTHLVTRVYFSDEDNAADPLLLSLPLQRRGTLIAVREDVPGGPLYRLDIRLQGEGETVFFNVY
ncbi:protocatechuate 3,4-dioxygenase subunit alpha [Deinococcus sp. QL22]|uniref:protocatechuate 3,4-dioxygenase subunit alpha n=1 Tax=Deinococcus sp. QL22 TaxID=2939437 RepID=UPI002016FEF1|nr:protocatechuate 3,4-dioxygenase subunit alpha [Deinococcus sp. QL22]UQN10249.1 protocatechuate 3,4-dioxygenase subunit alpha [Deinococcus sp. QL22]